MGLVWGLQNFSMLDSVRIGEKLSFSFNIVSKKLLGKLRIEYAIELNRLLNLEVYSIG